MTNYAYLRVDKEQQDTSAQYIALEEYGKSKKASNLIFIEELVTGRKSWQRRKLGELLSQTMKEGDKLFVYEVSQMARSTSQILEMLELASNKNMSVFICKQNLEFTDEGEISRAMMSTMLAMIAQIDRELISVRTKEALAARRAAGMSLGRPTGQAKKVKLDKQEKEIKALLKNKVSKRVISETVGCSPSTLYDWMKRRKIKL